MKNLRIKYYVMAYMCAGMVGISLHGETGHPIFTIHYHLEIIDPSHHLVRVQADFSNFPTSKTKIKIFPSYQADNFLSLDNVRALTMAKEPLRIVKEGNIYTISNGSFRDFTLYYDLTMNQFQSLVFNGPMGYLGDTYLLSKAAWTFAVPEEMPAEQYRVSFTLPRGWEVVCPWELHGDEYVETDFNRFIESSFAAGTFEVRERDIFGSRVRIAADTHFDRHFRDTLFENCFRIFSYIKSLFKTELPLSHLTIFTKPTGPDQWQFINEGGESHGEAVERINDAYYQYAHRLFHTYNAFPPYGMKIEPAWFVEGTNEYYDALVFTAIRAEYPLNRLSSIYDYYLEQRDRFDAPLSGYSWQGGEAWERTDFLIYKKGALVSYLLDREIASATDGTKSLADVLSTLYQTYAEQKGGTITEDIILDTVSRIAGKDLTSFFHTYVHAQTPVELGAQFLDDVDRDGVSLAGEEFIGTNPERADSDGDGVSDWLEFHSETDPLSATSRPDGPIFIDGFNAEWSDLQSESLTDPRGDSRRSTDILKIHFTRRDDFLYLMIECRDDVDRASTFRYFMNADLNSDGIADIHFAAVYRKSGDTLLFQNDGSTYGWRPMNEIDGLESAVGRVVEFKIPLSMLADGTSFQASLGVWDTEIETSLDSTPWLKIKFER